MNRKHRSHPAPTEAQITDLRSRTAPLKALLGGPDDLIELPKVATEFKGVLRLFQVIASDSAKKTLLPIERILDEILADHDQVAHWLSRRKGTTLKGYYRDNPHYATYFHRAPTLDKVPSYLALRASLLPVWVSLGKAQMSDPGQFRQIAYEFGLAIRKATLFEGKDKSVLLELPHHALSPTDLHRELGTLIEKYGLNHQVSGENRFWIHIFRVLQWFIDGVWTKHYHDIFKKSHHSVAGRKHGSSGAVETEAREIRVFLPLKERDPEFASLTKYLAPQKKGDFNEEESFEKNLALDATPVGFTIELEPRKVSSYFLVNRSRIARKNATYALQAIEMRNQHLPVGKSRLSGYELERFLSSLEDTSSRDWEGTPIGKRNAVAAWAACRFFLSRDENAIRKLTIQSSTDAHPDCIVWLPAKGKLRLPVLSPDHNPPPESIRGKLTISAKQWFSISPTWILLQCLGRLSGQTGTIFSTNLEREFAGLLSRLNSEYLIDLSPARISNVIRDTISQLAPSDEVFGHYFSGKPPNQCIPAIYSVIPEERMAKLFEEACRRVGERAGKTLPVTTATPSLLLVSDDDHHFGSQHVPRPEVIRKTIRSIQADLSNPPNRSWVDKHNRYTAYVTFFLLATTGVRLVSTLLPAIFDLDTVSGCCFISDKDDDAYTGSRVVWLHERLLKQIRFYKSHTVRVRQHLATQGVGTISMADARSTVSGYSKHGSPNRDHDLSLLEETLPLLFMVDERGSQSHSVLPSLLIRYIGDDWKLRVVSLRHYIRSFLLRTGVSGELINALLGHAEQGQGPWMSYSTFPPRIWKKEINGALGPLLDDFGLKALESPLIGATH